MPKYRLRQVHQITMLYIFWFLHQTTTGRGEGAQKGCCISFDSYIKPQLASCCFGFLNVVYLLIPTSNHNPRCDIRWWCALYIFWFLHQTTTQVEQLSHKEWLYIFWFLHQTTTFCRNCHKSPLLYIFWILHQTTTAMLPSPTRERCISFESYIKPQLYGIGDMISSVVYLLNPTSNHNLRLEKLRKKPLYIFWILHQTTTVPPIGEDLQRCISFESYIKPQLALVLADELAGCISFESYIKPQPSVVIPVQLESCISFESYIKPQPGPCFDIGTPVVYLLNPTSNHNVSDEQTAINMLYIFWILHQTTTWQAYLSISLQLYIFWILHQTTTYSQLWKYFNTLYIFWILHQTTTGGRSCFLRYCCISFESYIKPQPCVSLCVCAWVVYLLNPTSNHNCRIRFDALAPLYIFWFLHQTTTSLPPLTGSKCCISFESYIKPQLRSEALKAHCVVYLLNPTSNHNLWKCVIMEIAVVYLLNPTSNHNSRAECINFL